MTQWLRIFALSINIKDHAEGVSGLSEKLKLWDYQEVLNVHENLEYVNESINKLDLVPSGF